MKYNCNFDYDFNIRCILTQTNIITGDQSEYLVFDDAVQVLPEISFPCPSYKSLVDFEKIAVLKGPQGALGDHLGFYEGGQSLWVQT